MAAAATAAPLLAVCPPVLLLVQLARTGSDQRALQRPRRVRQRSPELQWARSRTVDTRLARGWLHGARWRSRGPAARESTAVCAAHAHAHWPRRLPRCGRPRCSNSAPWGWVGVKDEAGARTPPPLDRQLGATMRRALRQAALLRRLASAASQSQVGFRGSGGRRGVARRGGDGLRFRRGAARDDLSPPPADHGTPAHRQGGCRGVGCARCGSANRGGAGGGGGRPNGAPHGGERGHETGSPLHSPRSSHVQAACGSWPRPPGGSPAAAAAWQRAA